ncbi:MAG: hypothetical protein RML36_04865 [Anaerolineae bacterium]|nr:hypothetical protein [Anaerolineae bacterium]
MATLLVTLFMTGCAFRRAPRPTPTRALRPTFTPTPVVAKAVKQPTPIATAAPLLPTPTPTDTPIPPTPTPQPTDTPTPVPTATPTPTPAPTFTFELERAEQFPAQSPETEGVRIYLYVYSLAEFGLPGYSLRVARNGVPLTVNAVSVGGLPGQTRPGPSVYTRLMNMQVEFQEPPGGTWEVQLVSQDGTPAGPPAIFTLSADDPHRELYVRYRRIR